MNVAVVVQHGRDCELYFGQCNVLSCHQRISHFL